MTVFSALQSSPITLPLALFLLGFTLIAWRQYRLGLRDKAYLQRMPPTATPALQAWPDLPLVSILVAAWNEEENIVRHIQSFRALRYPAKEMVLCAGGTDRTYVRAAALTGENLTLLEQRPGEGKQQALRRGLQATRGRVIYLTDADCVLDDSSFEQTIYPIVCHGERACTGSSRPYPELQMNPFVAAQSASIIYRSQHWPDYAPGLLGRNCAVERQLLEASRGLDESAPTGTDYVLAKMITRLAVPIRQIPESRIATEYPTSLHGYIRQQRRWLRNVAIHGWRYGAQAEVRASLSTSLLGLGMLILPFTAIIVGRISLIAWLLLLTHGVFSRIRYASFAASITGVPLNWRLVGIQIPMLFLDFIAWSRPLLDYLRTDSEKIW